MLIAEYDYDMDIKVQREEAKEEGIRLGTVNNILEFLEDLGEIPETLKSKIMQEEKPDVLRRWLKLAAKAETVEECCCAWKIHPCAATQQLSFSRLISAPIVRRRRTAVPVRYFVPEVRSPGIQHVRSSLLILLRSGR